VILTLGETMGLAVTACGEPLQHASTARFAVAGAESTVAIGVRRLGVESCWVGVVGADGLGERIRRELRAEGVDVRFVRTDPDATTGFMLRELRTGELTRVTYYRAGSAGSRLSVRDIEAAFAELHPSVVHVTGITPALSDDASAAFLAAIELARSIGAAVSLDVNHRPSLPGCADAMKIVQGVVPDVLFVGDDELYVLTDETDPVAAVAALAAGGIPEIVVKRGRYGAIARIDGVDTAIDAFPVRVIDVVGAGDGFVAGYLAARAEGRSADERLRWATICAAYTVGSPGDWEGLPTRAELEQFDPAAATRR
jgi:2-dehydro-3-deoxygluconokinase